MFLINRKRILKWSPVKNSKHGEYKGIRWKLIQRIDRYYVAEYYRYQYDFIFIYNNKNYEYRCWTASDNTKEMAEQIIRHSRIRNNELVLHPEIPEG